MIYLIDANKQAVQDALKKTGVNCQAKTVFDFAKKREEDFQKNEIKESYRIGATCSQVWNDQHGAYSITIKRFTGGYWGLISSKGEPFNIPANAPPQKTLLNPAADTNNNIIYK